ncbi:hypothetical protein DFH11DRAFT_1168056 [Phellopilus nigrolimitatus]|nr:hypothetical protein DFH11DRAFT_1168056 [Phellopilus nigrolimitatus]
MFDVVSPQVHCVQSVGSPSRDPLDVRHVSKLFDTSSTSTVLPIVDEFFRVLLICVMYCFPTYFIKMASLSWIPCSVDIHASLHSSGLCFLPSSRAEATPKAASKVRMTMAIIFDGRSTASALTTCQALITDFATDVFSRLLVGPLEQNLRTLDIRRYCFLHAVFAFL